MSSWVLVGCGERAALEEARDDAATRALTRRTMHAHLPALRAEVAALEARHVVAWAAGCRRSPDVARALGRGDVEVLTPAPDRLLLRTARALSESERHALFDAALEVAPRWRVDGVVVDEARTSLELRCHDLSRLPPPASAPAVPTVWLPWNRALRAEVLALQEEAAQHEAALREAGIDVARQLARREDVARDVAWRRAGMDVRRLWFWAVPLATVTPVGLRASGDGVVVEGALDVIAARLRTRARLTPADGGRAALALGPALDAAGRDALARARGANDPEVLVARVLAGDAPGETFARIREVTPKLDAASALSLAFALDGARNLADDDDASQLATDLVRHARGERVDVRLWLDLAGAEL